MRRCRFLSIYCLGFVLFMALSCGDDGADAPSATLDELYDQGLIRYVDVFDPLIAVPPTDESGIRRYTFDVPEDPVTAEERGPLCLRGGQYTVDTREGPSDELLIFLQGGGACWPELCSAFEEAGPLPAIGILNPESEINPLQDWDVVYLPYCDGSLFVGDVDRVLRASSLGEGEGEHMAYQRGLQNLSAALDIAVEEFPNPSRILIAGISGGGFGTITATPLARFHYPNVPILVFNDSGIGVAKDGDRSFIENTLLAGWNASTLIPESCVDCTTDGHVTGLIAWTLENDPNLRVSALSYSADFVVAATFLEFFDPQPWTTALLRETADLSAAFPDRYKRFILEGTLHTVLLNDGTGDFSGLGSVLGSLVDDGNDVTPVEWLDAFLDDSETWDNVVAPSL